MMRFLRFLYHPAEALQVGSKYGQPDGSLEPLGSFRPNSVKSVVFQMVDR